MKRVIKIALSALTIALLLIFSAIPVFAEDTFRVQYADYFEVLDDYGFDDETRWFIVDFPLNAYGYHSAQVGETVDTNGVHVIRVPFSKPIQFKAGNYYTLHYLVQFAFESTGQLDSDYVYDLDISVDGVAPYSSKGTYSSGKYVTVRNDTTFYCYSDFTSEYLYITINNWESYDTDDPFLTLYSFTYDAMSDTEYQNQVISGAITNQTTQIQNQINQSTQDILMGSGLTGPVKPDVQDEKDAIDDIGSKEDEIEDLLGGYDNVNEDLEDMMDTELDADIVDALQGIQGVFTRLVDTLQLSSLITFLLVLGLGLYIIGRRTS